MIQICRKDEEKVYEAIRTGKIDAAEMSFPNLIDDIILTMKSRGLSDSLAQALLDKRRDTAISLLASCCALLLQPSSNARPASRMDVPFAVTEAELLAELEPVGQWAGCE